MKQIVGSGHCTAAAATASCRTCRRRRGPEEEEWKRHDDDEIDEMSASGKRKEARADAKDGKPAHKPAVQSHLDPPLATREIANQMYITSHGNRMGATRCSNRGNERSRARARRCWA